MTHVKDKTLGSPDASRRRRSATSSDEVAESCLGRFMLRRVSRRARRVVVRNVFNTLLSLPFVKLVAYTVRAMPCATCFHYFYFSTSPLLVTKFTVKSSRFCPTLSASHLCITFSMEVSCSVTLVSSATSPVPRNSQLFPEQNAELEFHIYISM
jgi:hypothetical protein